MDRDIKSGEGLRDHVVIVNVLVLRIDNSIAHADRETNCDWRIKN